MMDGRSLAGMLLAFAGQGLPQTAAAAAVPACPAAPEPTPGSVPEAAPEAHAVVRFWWEAGPKLWFAKDPAFDARFRDRFLALHDCATRGGLGEWGRTPVGALALVILLDQFPRNAFRGTPRMYATDVRAREVAGAAIDAGHMEAVARELRTFFVLPFGHSERLPDQEQAVRLARTLGDPEWGAAERHRGIIYRFGRFPHRNAILGRTSTAEEEAYLADGGYQG
jgi:uncharacterized protein (DUF924 family)